MNDPGIDGWYRAVGMRAVFAFRVEDGEVVECAPYGKKLIMGLRWATAYMVLEQRGFRIERMSGDPVDERAMRFGYLLSEIEVRAQRLLRGQERDILLTLLEMKVELEEATEIAQEVSREALDQVTRKE